MNNFFLFFKPCINIIATIISFHIIDKYSAYFEIGGNEFLIIKFIGIINIITDIAVIGPPKIKKMIAKEKNDKVNKSEGICIITHIQ